LHFPTPEPEPASDDAGTLSPEATVILEGGVTASAGWGVGQVWVSGSRDDFRQVPEDAVLVLPTLPPALVSIIGRLRAVVSEAGSQASHFASVAREFELPVLACVPEATKRLSPGQLVTVAANKRRVYLGDLKGVPRPPVTPFLSQEAPFLCRLHKLMKLVSPLHLIDPTAANFVPQECRSVHDLVRYAHEKGMAEMFSLVGRSGRGLSGARQLSSDLPISMYVLDLDGGISPEARSSKTVAPQDIISRPLRACWEGLTHPEVFWHKGLKFLDWQELDRISAGIMSLKSAALASYAVISGEYLHLLLRFGYHFAVIDALCGDNPEANYIAFRFKGGGGDYQNRLLRVQLLQAMLEWAGFAVKSRGDLLDARFERHGADKILARLTILGFLQGKTQLLDMALTTAEQVNQLAASFRASLVQYVTG
jgi:pyruvate,water dikinase